MLAHGTIWCILPIFMELASKWSASSLIFSLTTGCVVLCVTVSYSKRPPSLKSSWLAEPTMQASWGLTEIEVEPWRLQRAVLGPLHMLWWLALGKGVLDCGSKGIWLFCLLLGPLFSYWVSLLSLDMRLWPVLLFLAVPFWLMSLGDLIFFLGGDGGVLGSRQSVDLGERGSGGSWQ